MKKTILILAAVLCLVTVAIAQKKKKGEAQEKRELDKFRTDQSKLIPKLERLALAQAVLHFKLTTTARTLVSEKGGGRNIAGARVSAYLEFLDGDMTQPEYDAIADHFYSYFQNKLKEGGIDTVGWTAVTTHEFYLKVSEEDEKEELTKKKGGNEWATAVANHGKILHHGMAGFAGNKGKRAAEFSKDLKATAGIFELVVDFADVFVNLDIKSTEYRDLGNGWYRPASSTKTYNWAINPEMRIGNGNNTLPMIFNPKGWPEYIMMWNDIESKATYASSMTEDVSKARSGIAKQFAFAKELTPVLIQTTRENYKAAAMKTVESYADAFVEMCQRKRDK